MRFNNAMRLNERATYSTTNVRFAIRILLFFIKFCTLPIYFADCGQCFVSSQHALFCVCMFEPVNIYWTEFAHTYIEILTRTEPQVLLLGHIKSVQGTYYNNKIRENDILIEILKQA